MEGGGAEASSGESDSSGGGTNAGLVAGVVVLCIAVVVLTVVVALLYRRVHKLMRRGATTVIAVNRPNSGRQQDVRVGLHCQSEPFTVLCPNRRHQKHYNKPQHMPWLSTSTAQVVAAHTRNRLPWHVLSIRFWRFPRKRDRSTGAGRQLTPIYVVRPPRRRTTRASALQGTPDSPIQMQGSRSEKTVFKKLDLAPTPVRSASREGEYNRIDDLVKRTHSYEGALDEIVDQDGSGYEYAKVEVQGQPPASQRRGYEEAVCPHVGEGGEVVRETEELPPSSGSGGAYEYPEVRPEARQSFEPNAFVVDKQGSNLKLQSVRRCNPAYIQSVYLTEGDVVADAGIDGTAET